MFVGSINDLREFIREWNVKHPIDHFWRKKYNIPFNSNQHREGNFIDMRLDYEEELMFIESRKKVKDEESSIYMPGHGSWLKKRESTLSKEQIDDAFDNIDLDQFTNPGQKIKLGK